MSIFIRFTFCSLLFISTASFGGTVKGTVVALKTGSAHTFGWACETGNNSSIKLKVYAGGGPSKGEEFYSRVANIKSESAVAKACSASGTNYRYNFNIPKAIMREYGGQRLYVEGIVGGNRRVIGSRSIPTLPNTPPEINNIFNKSVLEGESFSFTPKANDADGDKLSFSISNKPSWASFSSSTGRLYGKPSKKDVRKYKNIKISVSDGKASDSDSFSIDVEAQAPAPTLSFRWIPSAIFAGETTYRKWESNNADSCLDNNGNPIDLSGESKRKPQTENISRTITCKGKGGEVKKTASLTIKPMEEANLISPVDNAELQGNEVCFSWNAAGGASYYTVQISSDANFNELSKRWVEKDLSGTSSCWSANFIANPTAGVTHEHLPTGTYFWRVKALTDKTTRTHKATFSPYRTLVILPSNNRRVIYIHTDVLGSPVAETDENGYQN